MQTIRYIQNGVEADGVTPKYEPRPLTARQSARCQLSLEHGPLLTAAFLGQVNPMEMLKNAEGDVNDTALGLQSTIDTLTYLRKQVVEQSFYEVALTDYGIIEQGDGAYMENILVTQEFDMSENFEAGNINQAGNADRLSQADSNIHGINVPLRKWGKAIDYSLPEVQQALARNNWDIIGARMRSRKRNWDLGIQDIFFLGSQSDNTNFPGLLNNGNITVQSTLPGGFTQLINSLNSAQFQTFIADIVQSYQANADYVKYPDYFIIPSDDYNGLGTATSSSFPIGTMLEYLIKTLRGLCGESFKILPSAYGVPANNSAYSGLNKHLYLLGKMDADSGHMNIPVDMWVTPPGTGDNFYYRSVGFGQYAGYNIFRPLDFLAFQF